DPACDLIELLDFKRQAHTFHITESIDENGHAIAFHVREKQGLIAAVLRFTDAIGDFGNLEIGGNRCVNTHQLSRFVENFEKLSEVVITHVTCPYRQSRILQYKRSREAPQPPFCYRLPIREGSR